MKKLSVRRVADLSRQLKQATSVEKVLEISKELGNDLSRRQARKLANLNLQVQALSEVIPDNRQ